LGPHHSNVVVSFKQLGDIVLLEPALRSLAETAGGKSHLITRPAFAPVVELMAAVVAVEAGQFAYETLWCPHWGSKAAVASWRARANRKVIIANKPRQLRWYHSLVFDERRIVPQPREYWARYHWQTIAAPSPSAVFHPPQLLAPPADWAHPLRPFEPYLLVHSTAAWERKYWLASAWADLIGALRSAGVRQVVLTGGPASTEAAHCRDIESRAGEGVANLCGATSLRELLDLVYNARGVIAIDGACAHLAAAFGRPTVVLFGETDERFWHWPTATSICVCAQPRSERPNLKHLPAARVLEAARLLLFA
jgi:ADP-heptose:LPS heptosyltransferase